MNEKAIHPACVMKPQTVKTIRVRTIRFAISAIYENRRDTFLDDVDDTCIDSRKRGFLVFHDKVERRL